MPWSAWSGRHNPPQRGSAPGCRLKAAPKGNFSGFRRGWQHSNVLGDNVLGPHPHRAPKAPLASDDPKEVGVFLRTTMGIDKQVLGDYLGGEDEFNRKVLLAYVETIAGVATRPCATLPCRKKKKRARKPSVVVFLLRRSKEQMTTK